MLSLNRTLIAERNDKLQTALHLAIINQGKKIIPILLDYGASVSTTDIYGDSALTLAKKMND
jgi:ankyrin repeat protein